MKKIIINENQKGFLFKDGSFVRLLNSGKHRLSGKSRVEIVSVKEPLSSERCELDTLLCDNEIAKQTSVIEIAEQQAALHYVNGKFEELLQCGKHAFWSDKQRHEYQLVDISTPEVDGTVPRYIFSKLPSTAYIKVEVAEYQKARLYFDQKLIRILDGGTHYFWNTDVQVSVGYVDTRLTQMAVCGQEIMTQDKVGIRVNFVCNYRVTDYARVHTEIDDYKEQLHVAAQLAMRDYVGKQKLDELLANKEEMSEYILDRLKQKESEFFVEFVDAGVKDIILPGEIRNIMNTVLIAEKRAQANVITRREEVASTRSLLNTAKLLDENKTLYKLKELECIERICQNVNNLNINGSEDVLSRLINLMQSGSNPA
ncbi:MAG: slipin family protein [Clostridia bacterium]|nr:slipin family protein [Clostridia bacterium]